MYQNTTENLITSDLQAQHIFAGEKSILNLQLFPGLKFASS